MKIRIVAFTVVTLTAFLASPLCAQQTLTRGGTLSADIARDGRVAIDLCDLAIR